MARGRKINEFVTFVFMLLCLKSYYCVNGESKVPCYFIFGDSLVDSGNNNDLATSAKVNYPPYGIDFPDGPTGRFTNGRTTADIIGEFMGFDNFIPPFSSANDSEILKGVNYASGSAGIRPETGKQLGENIDLEKQLQRHQETISKIVKILGSKEAATKLLNKCYYSFVIGNNDYINNYFVHEFFNTSLEYTPQEYAQALIQDYSQHIMALYKTGARKMGLTGIGPIGCTPYAMNHQNTHGSLCVDSMNQAANFFNQRLKSLVDELNNNLTDAKVVYLNTYSILSDYVASPALKIKINGCCEANEFGLCVPYDLPCEHRNLNIFWDSYHPSEIANRIGSRLAYLSLWRILFLNLKMAFLIKYLLAFFLLMIILPNSKIFCNGAPQVPCYFIFGDSLVDGGNNNNLNTTSKVNYSPYGIDFPNGPTGRFTNGRTVADIIGQNLGFDTFIPPFANVLDSEVLKGVNYASGSAGILFETGKHAGQNIEFDQQLRNHEVIMSRIARLYGNSTALAAQHLNKCLYISSIGSNDYINNFYLPNFFNSSKIYTPAQFADVLIKQYSLQLQQLYNLGARKIGVASVSSIGCTPNATAFYGTQGSICVDHMNSAANIFNRRLTSIIARLNLELEGATFIQMGSLGFRIGTKIPGIDFKPSSCCDLNEYGLCVVNRNTCRMRNLIIFWDGFHPTQIANKILGAAAYLILQTIL
ncbi:uncharacterized protein LOC126682071 [Mercurialis annua]|uniref:uncharacterized protein LOC126682071 n=1 Tax=Mercurialis annua TaxID=3986 RepID=UPI0024AD7D3B|nr:uncharacterized protein LOC126682071 [Mercurialis annua]